MESIYGRTWQLGTMAAAVPSIAALSAKANDAPAAGDRYRADGAEIVVTPLSQATFVLQVPGMVIYNDPVGGRALFKEAPPLDLILVCHEHEDHLDFDTLRQVVGTKTTLIVNATVMAKLPPDLRRRAKAMTNGETATIGPVRIQAIAAYHAVPEYVQYHHKGRDNGYLLTTAGRRIYILGDTHATPEVLALKDIGIAFTAISRWTLTPECGSAVIRSLRPAAVYTYHFESSAAREAFGRRAKNARGRTEVVL